MRGKQLTTEGTENTEEKQNRRVNMKLCCLYVFRFDFNTEKRVGGEARKGE